jgi:hypothetical protein
MIYQYPLAWPVGRPRTKSQEFGQFKVDYDTAVLSCLTSWSASELLKRSYPPINRSGLMPHLAGTRGLRPLE